MKSESKSCDYSACDDRISFDDKTFETSTISSPVSTISLALSTESMIDRTRDDFPRDFPIFPKETTTPKIEGGL